MTEPDVAEMLLMIEKPGGDEPIETDAEEEAIRSERIMDPDVVAAEEKLRALKEQADQCPVTIELRQQIQNARAGLSGALIAAIGTGGLIELENDQTDLIEATTKLSEIPRKPTYRSGGQRMSTRIGSRGQRFPSKK